MKETEVEFPVANVDLDEVITRIGGRFSLPLVRRGLTQVKDSFLDTRDFLLFSRHSSFRVRQKLEDIYRGMEIRLTFKSFLEEHPFLLVREELKLKTVADGVGRILDFVDGAFHVLINKRFEVKLVVEESSTEVYLGKPGAILNISYDRIRFVDPSQSDNAVSENALEVEDHGIGREQLIEVKEFIEEGYGLSPSTETKYCRGLRLLGAEPTIAVDS